MHYAQRGGSNIRGEEVGNDFKPKWDYGCPIPMNERE